MKKYYIVTWSLSLLRERTVEADYGYLLYEYIPESNIFIDNGYVKDLAGLNFIIRARYGFYKSVRLLENFEEVAKVFGASLPRIIHLARAQIFCMRKGDFLFSTKWNYDDVGRPFVKKMEWRLDGKEPKTIGEALAKLNEYAEKHGKWIVLREWIKSAVAYGVYQIP